MKNTKRLYSPWSAETPSGRGSWIKDARGQWVALSCGYTDKDAANHALLITLIPNMLTSLVEIERWISRSINFDRDREPALAGIIDDIRAIIAKVNKEQ